MSIKFGTDGWRAVISDTFTFNNLRLVAQAIADYVRNEGGNGRDPEVVIGFDTRFLSANPRRCAHTSYLLQRRGEKGFSRDHGHSKP